MRWLEEGLSRKFAIGTAAGLLISSLVFLVLFVGLYREQIEEERVGAASQVTELFQIALENAMLKRDLDGLTDIVDRLASLPGILGVAIANPRGEVRYTSDPGRFDPRLPEDQIAPSVRDTRFLDEHEGTVLRSIAPVHNRPACQECHGAPATNPVNGVLYVDFDAARIRQQARATTLLLMGSGALIVVINLAGGWWFMRRFVLRPVAHLTRISECLAGGDLEARATLAGRDELALLGERFNRMAATVAEKIGELREKEHFMQQLVDAVPDGIRVIDSDYRVVLANSTYRRQLGYGPDAELPEMCYAASHGLDRPCPEQLVACPLVEIEKSGGPLRVVHRHDGPHGNWLEAEVYAAPMRVTQHGRTRTLVVEAIRDLGQQVRFSHEQKLSELGRLAAGVAHEIHNPLASVKMALHAAEEAGAGAAPDRETVVECLRLVDQEVDKCIQVTERLLKLSVPPPDQHELVDVDRVLDDTLRLLAWEAESRSVELRWVGADTPLRILAADSDLRMAALNLAQNAIHAMPKGGVLTVRGERAEARVQIRFEDTGVGIERRDRLRIFEPFFTRRADGVRGTGLGLSITKSIVESHGGTIEVESEPGRGTRITLSFADADSATEADEWQSRS
jgi:signal transduction histidine kinase/HAMP domain-containing protein